MLPITVTQRDRLTQNTVLSATPRLTLSSNLNRVHEITSVSNPLLSSTELQDSPFFPVSSVVEAYRPKAGIVKAIAGSGSYPTIGVTNSSPKDSTTDTYTYSVSENVPYKYWQSEEMSDASVSATYGAGNYDLANAQIDISYDSTVYANKFVIILENSYVSPTQVTVEFLTSGTPDAYNLSNSDKDSDGNFVLWYLDTDTWSNSYDPSTDTLKTVSFDEIRVTFNAMDSAYSRAAVIEVAPYYIYDASELIQSVTNNDNISEPTPILPIGTISSNTAEVVLDNILGEFYEDETDPSSFANALKKGCEVTFDVNIHKPDVAVNSTEWTRVLTKYVDKKSYNEETAKLELKDSSMILQARNPTGMVFINSTVVKAVRTICHNVGFKNVAYDSTDLNAQDFGASIAYYWTDPERTAWEHIQEIAEATQTAIYFDEYDMLQIKTRSAAFDLGADTEWILDADDISSQDVVDQERLAVDVGKFADLISFSEEEQEKVNYADITYTDTKVKPLVHGNPTQVVSWEPDDVVVIRSGRIIEDIPAPDGVSTITVRFHSSDIQTWPYTGMFQVGGEVIEYYEKQYSYYNESGNYSSAYISSPEEKTALDDLNPGINWKNSFSGRVHVKPEGRGVKNTLSVEHTVQGRSWTKDTFRKDGGMTRYSGVKYFTKDFANGYFILDTAARTTLDWSTWVVAYPTYSPAKTPHLYGTRIKFPKSSIAAAGIAISLSTKDSGFYVELMPREDGPAGSRYNEVHMYWLDTSGNRHDFGPNDGHGVRVPLFYDTWYYLDVWHYTSSDSSSHKFDIYVDGRFMGTFTKTRSSSIFSLTQESGIFVRGRTRAYFDYYYTYRPYKTRADGEDYQNTSFLDLATGGYRSTISQDVLTTPFSTRSKLSLSNTGMLSDKLNYDIWRFEEVGLIGHEVRDFKVKYQSNPVVSSTLYMSNKTGAMCTDFTSSPLSANFTIVNTSRRNEVIYGEDTLTFGAENAVDQKLFVYGREITTEDQNNFVSKNDADIVKSGKNPMDFNSQWVQSEAQAQRLGEWVVNSPAKMSAEAEIFGNPFLQLLDIVGVQDEEEGRDWRVDKYFIVSKKVTYDGGLQVDLDLYSLV